MKREVLKRSLFSWGVLGAVGVLACLTWMGCGSHRSEPVKPLLEVIQARGKIQAGVKYDSKPFGFLDQDGAVKGYDVDLLREVAKRLLGSPDAVDFEQVLSSTRVFDINSGRLDVVAATMTITPEREELIDFTDPYFVAGQAVMVPTQSPIQKLSDLAGKRVLYVIGATSEANMRKHQPRAKLVGFKTALDALAALKAGRGEAMTTDDTILSGFMQGNCDYRLLSDRLSSEPYGMGLKQDPQHKTTEAFRQKINGILKDMKADGTLEKLKQKWVISGNVTAGCPAQ